jgi:hypothetical protein
MGLFPLLQTTSFRTQIKYVGIAAGIVLVVAFVLFQARFLLIGPQIILTEVPTGPQNERARTISGTAHNISHLWLNDRPIYTDVSGKFKEVIVLENGYTTVTLRAEDRYGRTKVVTTPLLYAPATFIN